MKIIWILFFFLSAPVIVEQITHSFNVSVSTGLENQSLENFSCRLSLHKGGEKSDPDKFRPFYKLCSESASVRVSVSAITLVLNDIFSVLDEKKHYSAIFVDLHKALDTLSSLLLHILSLVLSLSIN